MIEMQKAAQIAAPLELRHAKRKRPWKVGNERSNGRADRGDVGPLTHTHLLDK